MALKEDVSLKYILRYKNVFGFIAIIFIFYLVISKIIAYQDSQKNLIEKKIQALEQKKEAIGEFDKLSNDYQALARDFLAKDIIFFKQFVEENAERLGLEILSLRTNVKEVDLYWEVQMQLKISCAYSDFLNFMTALETKRTLVDSIKIIRKGGRSEIDLNLRGIVLR